VLAAQTKGGLAAATRSLAVGYASRGILVNAWHPALSRPRCTRRNSYRRPGGRLPSLGRGGQVSDVVDGVLLLESSP
jgi:NAD(P)-dependent dehydrogenase (short-subunit alcohol dehydrogenase family)